MSEEMRTGFGKLFVKLNPRLNLDTTKAKAFARTFANQCSLFDEGLVDSSELREKFFRVCDDFINGGKEENLSEEDVVVGAILTALYTIRPVRLLGVSKDLVLFLEENKYRLKLKD
jgi:hypothetical protein